MQDKKAEGKRRPPKAPKGAQIYPASLPRSMGSRGRNRYPQRHLMPVFTCNFDSILSSVICYDTSVCVQPYQGQALCMHVSKFGCLCITPAQKQPMTVLCSKDSRVSHLSHSWALIWPSIKQQLFKLRVSRSISLQPDMLTGLPCMAEG